MDKIVKPERSRYDRRKKTRRPHVKFTDEERQVYNYWYASLCYVLCEDMRKKKVKFFVLDLRDRGNILPKDAVREELRHVFKEDWKCSLDFDDINKAVNMKDDR